MQSMKDFAFVFHVVKSKNDEILLDFVIYNNMDALKMSCVLLSLFYLNIRFRMSPKR
jgi:hypothetical protein